MTTIEKKELAKIIKKAKGSLSLEEFASKIGITKYQLSRIINGKFKEMPRKSTLTAICENSESEEAKLMLSFFLSPITYENINGEFVEKTTTPEAMLAKFVQEKARQPELERFEKNWNYLLGSLGNIFAEWTKKPDNDPLEFDAAHRHLFIELNTNTTIKQWHFYFLLDGDLTDETLFYHFIGKLSCHPLNPTEKFSLVVASNETYDRLCMKATNTNATLSVILINSEQGFISEYDLETAEGISPQDLAEIQIY